MMNTNNRPEIAKSIKTGSYKTNYHDQGEGFPVIFIHGSGPGVSAWANWRLIIPKISPYRRVLAPDMVGFGYTERPEGVEYTMDNWVQQMVDFMDALGIAQADLVGNSFGGGLALAMAVEYPERVRKLILMGAMGVNFPITEGLDAVWGYTPSPENMLRMLDLFVDDKSYANQELANIRYEASIEPGFQEAFSSMFPAPRQRWVESMAKHESRISEIKHPTLIVHGREDQVIPVDNAYKLINMIDNAQLHIFGHTGHWTQIERAHSFANLVNLFLDEEG
ncbi:MAG TPA: alpha/beta fold hydrolase [Mogibacterium sp.]|nr:alpha/beta fold hydrolase [Mogibacterium sp.]